MQLRRNLSIARTSLHRTIAMNTEYLKEIQIQKHLLRHLQMYLCLQLGTENFFYYAQDNNFVVVTEQQLTYKNNLWDLSFDDCYRSRMT